MSTVKGGAKQADLAKKLIAGTQKHLSNAGQLAFAGGVFTPSQVEAQLQALATLRADVESAQATAKAKVTTERARLPALRAFLLAFVGLLNVQFGTQPDVLADFGLKPKKARRPMTPEQKAAAKAKRDATRKARGIIGTRKRAAVKGDVTGVIVTPVTEAQPPAAQPVAQAPTQPVTPQPAPTASNGTAAK